MGGALRSGERGHVYVFLLIVALPAAAQCLCFTVCQCNRTVSALCRTAVDIIKKCVSTSIYLHIYIYSVGMKWIIFQNVWAVGQTSSCMISLSLSCNTSRCLLLDNVHLIFLYSYFILHSYCCFILYILVLLYCLIWSIWHVYIVICFLLSLLTHGGPLELQSFTSWDRNIYACIILNFKNNRIVILRMWMCIYVHQNPNKDWCNFALIPKMKNKGKMTWLFTLSSFRNDILAFSGSKRGCMTPRKIWMCDTLSLR